MRFILFTICIALVQQLYAQTNTITVRKAQNMRYVQIIYINDNMTVKCKEKSFKIFTDNIEYDTCLSDSFIAKKVDTLNSFQKKIFNMSSNEWKHIEKKNTPAFKNCYRGYSFIIKVFENGNTTFYILKRYGDCYRKEVSDFMWELEKMAANSK